MAEIIDEDPYPPQGLDLSKPSIARVYDYFLGGTANWAIDRAAGDVLIQRFPGIRETALANRLFLRRVVRYLIKQGIHQFIDIGSGVPTVGNTHEVADEASPDTHVVYVDNEPVAVAHSTILLEQHGDLARHATIHADLRAPEHLWEKVAETGKINLDEPVGLLVLAVLHVAQPGPDGTDVGSKSIAKLRELLPSGSYLALSVAGTTAETADTMQDLKESYAKAGIDGILRNEDEFRELFGDFALIEPGVTWTHDWHTEEAGPDEPATPTDEVIAGQSALLAGVAKKA